MARITTRDCECRVPNRFELVLLAARRAHDLCSGAEPQLPLDRDKPTVLALREIAAGRINPDVLRERLIERFMSTTADMIAFDIPPCRTIQESPPATAHCH